MNATVLIQGGLGNQLFQIAWMNYLKNHYGLNVSADMYIFNQQKQHSSISFLSLFGDSVTFPEVNKSTLIFDNTILAKITRSGLRNLHIRSIPHLLLFDYDALTTWEYCLSNSSSHYHYGYFQFPDAALFSREFLFSCIKNKHSTLYSNYEYMFSDCVGIHVRRGDFLKSNNSLHIPSQVNYIKKAINFFENRKFVVFSDDIDWCKNEFDGLDNVQYFSGESAVHDFIGLSCCKDYILSGSTFSWWASFINSNATTKIIHPKSMAQFMSVASNQKIGWDYAEIQ